MVNLATAVMKEAVKRAGIDPSIIDDVRFGNMYEHYTSMNLARVASIQAGIPYTTNAVTINRVCVSGMEAAISGMAMIQAGLVDVILAGGAEHMSGVPYAAPGPGGGAVSRTTRSMTCSWKDLCADLNSTPAPQTDHLQGAMPYDLYKGKPYIMGHTAEFVAQMYDISRQEMDEVALRSHNNVERATKDGDFAQEIVPLEIPQKKGKPPKIFDKDEHFRPGITMEALSKLPPAFIPKVGKVTAGNASGLNDGASAMIIMSAERAKELGLKPLARIRAVGYGGCDPTIMGISPVPAITLPHETLQAQDRRLRTDRAERGICRPVPGVRKRAGAQQGDLQRERLGHRAGPPHRRHGQPDHGDPDPCHEEAGQDARSGIFVRRGRGVHGHGHRDALTKINAGIKREDNPT